MVRAMEVNVAVDDTPFLTDDREANRTTSQATIWAPDLEQQPRTYLETGVIVEYDMENRR